MKRLLLASALGVLALSPAAAEARNGYLHRADAQAAVERYASGAGLKALGGGSYVGVQSCMRRASRVVDCKADYTGISMGDVDWDLAEVVRVTMHAGHVKAVSRAFE